jgi:hypothetical protein
MPGPMPKDPAIRRRRNHAATRATLEAEEQPRQRAPSLPARAEGTEWHKLTRAWWKDVWASPMAGEFLQVDVHGLYLLAELVDAFWEEPSKEMAGEIRLQRQCFGLTPVDRRRLQWEIERVEEATQRKRRPAAPVEPVDDPRSVLRIVGGTATARTGTAG